MTKEEVHTHSLIIEEGNPNCGTHNKQSTIRSEKPQAKRWTALRALRPHRMVYFVKQEFYM